MVPHVSKWKALNPPVVRAERAPVVPVVPVVHSKFAALAYLANPDSAAAKNAYIKALAVAVPADKVAAELARMDAEFGLISKYAAA